MTIFTLARDIWDWIALWATVAAAALAAVALFVAAYAIRRGDRTLVRERRMTFELGVLEQIASACGRYWSGSQFELRALIRLLDDDDLPELRQKVDNNTAALGENLLNTHWNEYASAVDRRRHPPNVASEGQAGQSRLARLWARIRRD